MIEILKYIQKSIDENALIHKWNSKDKLSLYLAGSFEYYMVNLLDVSFLLVRPFEQQTVQKLKTQIALIEEQTKIPAALFLEEYSGYRIKKMLRERIPFIAINQLYLPFVALHFKKQRYNTVDIPVHEKFTPATQLIFLYILYAQKKEFELIEVAEKLNISSMTTVRGMNELNRIGLVDYKIGGKTGRKKYYERIDQGIYYSKGKNYLLNPIKKIMYVSEIPLHIKMYKSGLTALGEQTMLGEPKQMVYAADGKAEILLKENQVSRETALEELMPKVQIMKYDIGLLSQNNYIDPISLICGLDEKDDRIELAIEELMEDTEWFAE